MSHRNFVLTQKRVNSEYLPFHTLAVKPEKSSYFHKAIYRLTSQNKHIFYRASRYMKIINAFQPDVIHAHFGPNGVKMHHLLNKFGINVPLLTSLHGTDTLLLPQQDPHYKNYIQEMSLHPNRMFTVNSDFLKAAAIQGGIRPEAIAKLKNAFNSSFTEYRKESFFTVGNPLKIVTTGRLVKWKGHEYLIRGFAQFIKDKYPNAKLTIIGEGPERQYLTKLIQELQLQHCVQLLGVVNHTDLPAILKRHDVYVQPSIKDPITQQEETFGIAILEAAAVGLPVIVTDTGGIPEVVGPPDQQFVFIVPPQRSDAFYRAFASMVDKDYSFKDNHEYFVTLSSKFSIQNHINRLVTLYRKLKK